MSQLCEKFIATDNKYRGIRRYLQNFVIPFFFLKDPFNEPFSKLDLKFISRFAFSEKSKTLTPPSSKTMKNYAT